MLALRQTFAAVALAAAALAPVAAHAQSGPIPAPASAEAKLLDRVGDYDTLRFVHGAFGNCHDTASLPGTIYMYDCDTANARVELTAAGHGRSAFTLQKVSQVHYKRYNDSWIYQYGWKGEAADDSIVAKGTPVEFVLWYDTQRDQDVAHLYFTIPDHGVTRATVGAWSR
jgi:hypothetical protein